MNKPANYDTTNTGSYTPPMEGGHHLIIKQVNETTSKAGKPMAVVLFDFAPNDKQPNYMSEEFKNDIRPDKKWPHAGTQYILSEDENGNCSRNIKRFVEAYEKSNNCSAIWGDKWASQFKNKKIGGVFGKVENEYNGKTTMRTELRWFCNDDQVEGADIPAPKYLNKNGGGSSASTNNANTANPGDPNAFMPVGSETGEIPWA